MASRIYRKIEEKKVGMRFMNFILIDEYIGVRAQVYRRRNCEKLLEKSFLEKKEHFVYFHANNRRNIFFFLKKV